MNVTKIIRNFFGFSRMETNGFLVLIVLLILTTISLPVYRKLSGGSPNFETEARQLDSLIAKWDRQQPRDTVAQAAFVRTSFDPNTASVATLTQLGFPPALAKRLVNYRSKGGRFSTRQDLLKLYGMDSSLFVELNPYILLPDQSSANQSQPTVTPAPVRAAKTEVAFDINTADTTLLQDIHGIGPKLSLRIVRYRESLGGFIHLAQLGEVFGLDTAIVRVLMNRSFVTRDFEPVQLNINEASEDALDKHPYLTRREAKAIVTYRFQHGRYATVADLSNVVTIDPSVLKRATPYLTVE